MSARDNKPEPLLLRGIRVLLTDAHTGKMMERFELIISAVALTIGIVMLFVVTGAALALGPGQ